MALTERDKEILAHVGLHRITTRRVLEARFLGGGSSAHLLDRLRKGGWLREPGPLSSRTSYYQLTPKGAALLGLPGSRARKGLDASSLHALYQALVFCHSERAERELLEPYQLTYLLDGVSVPGLHCRESRMNRTRLLDVYSPEPTAGMPSIMRRVQNVLQRRSVHPYLHRLIRERQYGFAILVDNKARQEAIKGRLASPRNLHHEAYFSVSVIPPAV